MSDPKTKDPSRKLLRRIEAYMRRHGITAKGFGVACCRDTNFVYSLREGREMRRTTRQRVEKFISKPPKKETKNDND